MLGLAQLGLVKQYLPSIHTLYIVFKKFSENIHPRKTETLMSTWPIGKSKTSSNIFSILQLQITRVNISQADTEAFFTDGILTMSLRSKSMGYLLLILSMKG